MVKNTGRKIALGVFVSVGMLCFIVAIYYIGKKQQLFSETFHINAIFRNVRGLQAGNNVQFSGINIGIVEEISILTDTTVKANFVINENARKFIRKNAGAIIGSEGLMGNKVVMIVPGSAGDKVIEDNDCLKTLPTVSIDDILGKLKTTGDHAEKITGDLAFIMGNIRSGKGTVGKLFMDSSFATNLDKTVVNLKKGASGFSQNMEAAKHSFLFKGLFRKKKREDKKREEKKKELGKK